MDTQKLRQRILDLAIRGKLVPQDPNDEPASVLLDRIRAEKERLIAEGKIKRPKAKKSTDKSHYQQLPVGWCECELGEIAKIVTDFVASGSFAALRENVKYYDSPNYAVLVRTKDLSNNFSKDLVYTDNHGYTFLSNSNLFGGELILPNIGASIGKVFIMPKLEHLTTLAPNSIMLRCWDEVTLQWLYYFFCSGIGQNTLKFISSSTAQGKFNKTDFKRIRIPIPPLEEQNRVVNYVSSVEELLQVLESEEANLDKHIKLAKAKILDLAMRGKLVLQDPADEPAADMLRRVNPKAKIITDNPHYPQLPDNWVLTTVESVCNYGYSENVSVDDIAFSEWILELEDIEKDSGRVVAHKLKKDRKVNGVRHRFVNGDVLYSKLRTYLNKVLVAQTDGYCTTEIIPVKSYDCVIPEYLCAWLRSPFFLSYAAECCYGVKMPRLSTTDARKGIIPLPPINEQKRITQKLSKVSELLSSLSNSID